MVRELHKGDISDFFPLRLEALERDPTAFGSSYEEEMAKGPAWLKSILSAAKDNNAVFGAFYETKLVGTIGIYSDHHVKSSHKVTIWGMYVRSDYRRKGLGKTLVAKAIDHAKFKMNARTVYLSVESNNLAAKNLYLGCGFKVWGREPIHSALTEYFTTKIICFFIWTLRRIQPPPRNVSPDHRN